MYMSPKHDNPSTPSKQMPSDISDVYRFAVADTITAPHTRFIPDMTPKQFNDALVSEIRRGLGDTTDSDVSPKSSASISKVTLDPKTQSNETALKQNHEPLPQLTVQLQDEACLEGDMQKSVNFNGMNLQSMPQTHHSKRADRNTRNQPSASLQQQTVVMASTPTIDLNAHHKSLNGHHDSRSRHLLSDLETPIATPMIKKSKSKTPSREIDIGAVVAQRYEVLSEISRGGYGVVYRARQIGLDRIVALKRLRSQHDKSVMQRFLLEAEIIKSLIHPNTVQLIDAGMDDNHMFIVMEYIEGQSLRGLLTKESRVNAQRAIHITKQILKSVNEAHQKGIIHRDLKPSNIVIREVIGEKDFVKVLDFGIAKARRPKDMQITQDGKLMGTPQYIAPELFWGSEAHPGTDIFAIGLMLAEMVSGKALLPSDPLQAAKAATSSAPIALPSWLSASDLGPIIAKALEKKPENRYQNADDMIRDLELLESKISGMQKLSTTLLETEENKDESAIKPYQIAVLATLFAIANALIIYHFVL